MHMVLTALLVEVSVAGRVMNYRKSSAKLLFLDLVGDGEQIQVP